MKLRTKRAWLRHDGQVLIMFMACVVVLLGFAALSIDVGMVFTSQTELQNVADAAAYAGVSKLAEDDYDGAINEAVYFGNLNTVLGQANTLSIYDVELGTYDFTYHQFVAAPPGAPAGSNAIRVTARRSSGSAQGPVTLAFGPVLGNNATNVEATTISAVDHRVTGFDGSFEGILMPFAVSESMVGNPPIPGHTFNMYPNTDQWEKDGGPTQSAPGNFGLLDLAGGPGAVGTPTLRDWIDNGYPLAIELPPSGSLPVEGEPGLRNTIRTNVANRIGETVVVFVHNGVTGHGSNSVYNVVGLLAVEILSVSGNGTNLEMNVAVVQYSSPGFITGSGGAYSLSVTKTTLVQ